MGRHRTASLLLHFYYLLAFRNYSTHFHWGTGNAFRNVSSSLVTTACHKVCPSQPVLRQQVGYSLGLRKWSAKNTLVVKWLNANFLFSDTLGTKVEGLYQSTRTC